MFLDHVDIFGKVLKFFVQKHFLPMLKKNQKKKKQNILFCHFLKKQFLVNFPC